MTFEEFLEQFNVTLGPSLTTFLHELGYGDRSEVLSRTLEYGIAYADFFKNDEENNDFLIFLKAISVVFIFHADEDTEIESGNGRLWEWARSALSIIIHRRIMRIPLNKDDLEIIFQPLKFLNEEEAIYNTLLTPFRDRLEAGRKQATSPLRYAMAQALLAQEENDDS